MFQRFDEKSTKEVHIHKKEVQTEAIVDRPKSGQIDWHDYKQIKADSLRKGIEKITFKSAKILNEIASKN
jgi:hypothetical protein